MTSRSFSAVIKELDGELARVVSSLSLALASSRGASTSPILSSTHAQTFNLPKF